MFGPDTTRPIIGKQVIAQGRILRGLERERRARELERAIDGWTRHYLGRGDAELSALKLHRT